jgi:hypothetical protein
VPRMLHRAIRVATLMAAVALSIATITRTFRTLLRPWLDGGAGSSLRSGWGASSGWRGFGWSGNRRLG